MRTLLHGTSTQKQSDLNIECKQTCYINQASIDHSIWYVQSNTIDTSSNGYANSWGGADVRAI